MWYQVVSSHDGLQNGFSFLGNISSILQQQEQAIAAALVPRTPSTDHTRGLKQVLPHSMAFILTHSVWMSCLVTALFGQCLLQSGLSTLCIHPSQTWHVG